MCIKNELLNELIKHDCIKIGNFRLKSGDMSKYYFDMKNLISYPKLLSKVGDQLYKLMDMGYNDIICGVPMGGLPIASYISTKYNIPMIIPREEQKGYGMEKQIEGIYRKESRCVIIEDVITTGGSVQKIIDLLEDKVTITEVLVIVDRQHGYSCKYPLKPLFSKTDIVLRRLNNIITKKNSRLCFSGDLDNKENLLKMLEEIGDNIVICKLHLDMYEDDNDFKEKLLNLSINKDFLIMEDRKFVDISYIVEKQYNKFRHIVDMVTVMATVSEDVIKKLSGVVIVANMSNNSWDFSEQAKILANNTKEHVLGFVTQKRITMGDMICMTPGISMIQKKVGDQNYRKASYVDTDIIIVGRGIYNDPDYKKKANEYSLV